MKAPQGQNFLYQNAWLERVAAAIGASDAMVEIGGGPGGLSALLAEQCQQLWVVEVDPKLANGLRPRFNVIEDDILNVDLSGLAREAGLTQLRVAGNIPYYITSSILLHLFRHVGVIMDAHIMVQREVAMRLIAGPGSKAFGLLSATAQAHARVEHLFDIPPGAFRPAPKVHSALVRLTMAPRFAALGVEREAFLRFLRRGFAHKRKQLGGFLADPVRAGLPARARAEELSLEQWAQLYHTVE